MSSKPEAVIDLTDPDVEMTDPVIDLTKSELEEELFDVVSISPPPNSPTQSMEPGVPGPPEVGILLGVLSNHLYSSNAMQSMIAGLRHDMQNHAMSKLSAEDRNNSRKRILKELAEYERSDNASLNYTIEYKDENMYEWIVRIKNIPKECDLAKSLDKNGIKEVVVKIGFPQRYPNIPPVVGLLEPLLHSQYITPWLLFCMDLLQNDWNPAYSAETVLAHVMQALQIEHTYIYKSAYHHRRKTEDMVEEMVNFINNK